MVLYCHNKFIVIFQMFKNSKKEAMQKEKKTLYMKDVVNKNPIFTKQHIDELFELFSLYCDTKRQCDITDIINTAKTLGFNRKYKIIYYALTKMEQQLNGQWIDFQTFLTLLTDKLGNPFHQEGRKAMFDLVDPQSRGSLELEDLKRISQQLKYNLSEEQLIQVINNVSGFGKTEITFDQFNKYIARKIQKKNMKDL